MATKRNPAYDVYLSSNGVSRCSIGRFQDQNNFNYIPPILLSSFILISISLLFHSAENKIVIYFYEIDLPFFELISLMMNRAWLGTKKYGNAISMPYLQKTPTQCLCNRESPQCNGFCLHHSILYQFDIVWVSYFKTKKYVFL